MNRLTTVMNDERAIQIINGGFFAIQVAGKRPSEALGHMADTLCGLFGLSAEVHGNAVVLYTNTTRAKHPACLVVSMQGAIPSPSATAFRHTALALIQSFEGDTDDSDMAGDCSHAYRWIKTKDRVLFH